MFWGRPKKSLPQNPHFWQVSLLDFVLSEYPDEFQKLNFYDVMTLVLYSTGFLIFLNPRLDLQIKNTWICLWTGRVTLPVCTFQ